ncbi:Npt1/Npt2 family nucleotide transporter [Candidatus Latescibacterota bacterium]
MLLVTYYFLKPARDSLFLVKLGPGQLPVVFILIALIVAPITSLYSRAGKSLRLNRLITVTTVILISNLFILRWLVQLGDSWVYYTFYIWVSIYGILSTSQFWLFANAVYNAAQAKRLFVLLTLGGILGAFTGGELTGFVVRRFGVSTENLLFFCVGFLVLCLFLANSIWRLLQKSGEQLQASPRRRLGKADGIRPVLGTIHRSRHLMYIVGIITMTMIVASFVDYQFKTVTVEAFPEKAELTSFFGKFYGRLSLASLFFHIIFSYTLLRVLGVGGVILFLPLGLLAGSAVMLIYPGLLAGIFMRGVDGSLKHSIDKTGRELLFMPVPLEVKKRTKIFIDVVVDRGARGIAGGLLLLSLALNIPMRGISLIVIVFLAAWIIIAVLSKREYLNAFRTALAKREIDPNELRTTINEVSTIAALKTALKIGRERQVDYALDMLNTAKGVKLADDVKPLLSHTNSNIRLKAVQILQKQGDSVYIDEIEELLKDPDPDVRLASMRYMCEKSGDDTHSLMQGFLESSDPQIMSTAVRCIAEHGTPEHKRQVNTVLEKIHTRESTIGEDNRIQLTKALGALSSEEYRPHLMDLMRDQSPAVVHEAIKSAGRTRDRDFIPGLLKKLAHNNFRVDARNALAEYGSHVLGTLNDYLEDDSVDLVIRKNIPGVLRKIPTQESVDLLTANLTTGHPTLKFMTVKALNKLRARYDTLRFDSKKINSVLIRETVSYYEVLSSAALQKKRKPSTAGKLLGRALEEKLDRHLELIFRLLGLRYPSKDIFNAYLGVTGGTIMLRANAVEYLDNVLSKELKKYIMPILDLDSPNAGIQSIQRFLSVRIETMEDALIFLIKGHDPWLRSCALFLLTEGNVRGLDGLVRETLNDPDPVVRETAVLVLEKQAV